MFTRLLMLWCIDRWLVVVFFVVFFVNLLLEPFRTGTEKCFFLIKKIIILGNFQLSKVSSNILEPHSQKRCIQIIEYLIYSDTFWWFLYSSRSLGYPFFDLRLFFSWILWNQIKILINELKIWSKKLYPIVLNILDYSHEWVFEFLRTFSKSYTI